MPRRTEESRWSCDGEEVALLRGATSQQCHPAESRLGQQFVGIAREILAMYRKICDNAVRRDTGLGVSC